MKLTRKKVAASGNIKSMTNIAFIYNAYAGFKANFEKARYWYEKAAESGAVNSMYHLGYIYYRPYIDVEKNLQKAFEWWEKGDVLGQYLCNI